MTLNQAKQALREHHSRIGQLEAQLRNQSNVMREVVVMCTVLIEKRVITDDEVKAKFTNITNISNQAKSDTEPNDTTESTEASDIQSEETGANASDS